jgi:hypothetical protein
VQQVREDMKCLANYARQASWPKQQLRFLKEFLDEYEVGGETA